VLISGSGTNLKALLEAADRPDFPARVVAVGADVEADGLAFAEERGIPTFIVPLAAHPDRDAWGAALLEQIRVWAPELTVLSGFMRLLPPGVVDALSPALVNTHPAYLPEFPGAHAVRDALAAGVTQTGASVIVVDSGIDTGPIVVRERVPVHPGDTEATLHARIKPVERRLLIDVVRGVAEGALRLESLGAAAPATDAAPAAEQETS